jgi:hypothetical protein
MEESLGLTNNECRIVYRWFRRTPMVMISHRLGTSQSVIRLRVVFEP